MSLPEPPSSLDGSCTVVWDNTLYSYTPGVFLSLKLKEGEKWKELDIGETVTGATCVGTSPSDPENAGFFLIGGAGGSTGLQKYTYSTGKWTTITPGDPVTKNRQWHSSTYVKAQDSILIYAGTTDGSEAAGLETFMIKAVEPYSVSSSAASAPLAKQPILLPWSDNYALMVGPDTGLNVYWYKPEAQSWNLSGASLTEPVAATTKGALVKGSDGSQNLFLFDLSQTPNKVTRVVIEDAEGIPVANSPTLAKRDSDWPSYNSSSSPNFARTNYAVTQDGDGRVYVTGGGGQEPLSIFDTHDNSWIDVADLLVKEKSVVSSASPESSSASPTSSSKSKASSVSSTASSSLSAASASTTGTDTESATETGTELSTATGTETDLGTGTSTIESTASASTTDASGASSGGDGDDSGLSSNVILGISLGSIFAFLLLLGLLFFLIRRHKMRRHKEMAQARGMGGDEKDPDLFGNSPAPPLPNNPPGYSRGHRPQPSADSFSSMAILMGRMKEGKQQNVTRNASQDTSRSSVSSIHKQLKSIISKPIPRDDSHSMLNGQAAKGANLDRALTRERDPSLLQPRVYKGPQAAGEDPEEIRRSSGWNRYWSGGSALQVLGFGSKRITAISEHSSHYSENTHANQMPSRVTQDSATVPPLNIEGRPNYARVNSGNVIVTGHQHDVPLPGGMAGRIERPTSHVSSGYSSGVPESVTDVWGGQDTPYGAWGADRAPSSVYNSTFSLGNGWPQGPSRNSRPHKSGVSTQPQLAMASQSGDMSWLNLGNNRPPQN